MRTGRRSGDCHLVSLSLSLLDGTHLFLPSALCSSFFACRDQLIHTTVTLRVRLLCALLREHRECAKCPFPLYRSASMCVCLSRRRSHPSHFSRVPVICFRGAVLRGPQRALAPPAVFHCAGRVFRSPSPPSEKHRIPVTHPRSLASIIPRARLLCALLREH